MLFHFLYLFTVTPTILVSPPPLNVTLFEDAIVLTCNASGFPVPALSWSHNGTNINVTANTRLNIETQDDVRSVLSILRIVAVNVNVNDSGEYACTVSSSLGDTINKTALVLVQGVYVRHKFCSH